MPADPLPEPAWFRPGLAALLDAHPELRGVPMPLPWVARVRGLPGLLKTLCGQQVSHAAAQSIWRRLSAIPGALDPAVLPTLDDDTLCGLGGLTRSRAAHARAIAAAVRDGALDPLSLPADDDAAVAALVAVKGIGPWTAEVHLVLSEARPDVFPAGDVALQSAAADLLALPARPDARAMRQVAARWAPWRGIAARLLWHHWLLATNRPAWTSD